MLNRNQEVCHGTAISFHRPMRPLRGSSLRRRLRVPERVDGDGEGQEQGGVALPLPDVYSAIRARHRPARSTEQLPPEHSLSPHHLPLAHRDRYVQRATQGYQDRLGRSALASVGARWPTGSGMVVRCLPAATAVGLFLNKKKSASGGRRVEGEARWPRDAAWAAGYAVA